MRFSLRIAYFQMVLTTVIMIVAICMPATTEALPLSAAESMSPMSINIPKRWKGMPSDKLNELGKEYSHRNMPDSALLCFSVVANRYEPGMKGENAIQCAYAYNYCGHLYCFDYFDFQKALENLMMAEKVYNDSESDDSSVMVSVYQNMASVYMMYEEVTDQTSFFSKKALELYSKAFRSGGKNFTEQNVKAFINMASIYPTKEEYTLIRQDVEYMDTLTVKKDIHLLNYAKAQAKALKSIVKGDIKSAISWYEKQITMIDPHYDSVRYLLNTYESLYDLYLEISDYGKAIDIASKIDEIAMREQEYDVIVRMYKKLSSIYTTIGDSKKSQFYHAKYLEYKDSLATASHVGKISDIYFLAEVDNMKSEIAYSENKNRRQMIVIVAGSVILLVITLFSLFIYRKNRMLRQRNQTLYLKNKEILEQLEASQKVMVTTAEEKYTTVNIKDDEKQRLKKSIVDILCSSDEIFKSTFSLAQLSELVGGNQRYVSQVVNEMFGKNFNSLLNEYRIAEACRKLEDSKYMKNMTIESIANSVGFKSRNAFGAAFKKQTGLTPSEWVRSSKMPLQHADSVA